MARVQEHEVNDILHNSCIANWVLKRSSDRLTAVPDLIKHFP